MKKAFTMIELIFVIVVLGILAAVAVPRLTNIQNEARASVEKATIGDLRTGLTTLATKLRVNPNKSNIAVNVDGTDGSVYEINLSASDFEGTYPKALSLGKAVTDSNVSILAEKNSVRTQNADLNNLKVSTTTQVSAQNVIDAPRAVFAIVLNQSVDDNKWIEYRETNSTSYIKGPASDSTSGVTDAEVTITNVDGWKYSNQTGSIVFIEN